MSGTLLDKNGRIFGKLNIIDLLVIVLLVGLVLAVFYRFTSASMLRENNCEIEYTIMIEGVRDFTLPYYQVGLECYDKNKEEFIGHITSSRYEILETNYPRLDGTLTIGFRPNDYRVYVSIKADARETESSYLINGVYELKIGSQLNLNTKYTDVVATIVSVNIIDKY